MHTPTVRVADVDLPFIEYQGEPVVTFAMIDAAHQRPKGTASRNYRKNRQHFIEREDLYLIDSNRLDEIRRIYPGLFPEAMKRVTFFTETGYLMLVKSFTDDLAWQVQRQLVRAYFRERAAKRQPVAQGLRATPSTLPPDPTPIDHHQRKAMSKLLDDLFSFDTGLSGHNRAYNLLRVRYNLKNIDHLPAAYFDEAMSTLRAMKPQIAQFREMNRRLHLEFYAQVIGQGETLTKHLADKLGGAQQVPDRPDWKAIASQLLRQEGLLPGA